MKKPSEIFFNKYEYLAIFYARKLFKLQFLSFDKDDIFQEFRIKLYDIIIAYGHRWYEYKNKERGKPIPLIFYIRASLNNFVYDYIQEIKKTSGAQYILPNNFESMDYGETETTISSIDLEKGVCIIDGQDIFSNLNPEERNVLNLFLLGFSNDEILNCTSLKKSNVFDLIEDKKKELKVIYDEIRFSKKENYFVMNLQD
jgi:hypothetical protein